MKLLFLYQLMLVTSTLSTQQLKSSGRMIVGNKALEPPGEKNQNSFLKSQNPFWWGWEDREDDE